MCVRVRIVGGELIAAVLVGVHKAASKECVLKGAFETRPKHVRINTGRAAWSRKTLQPRTHKHTRAALRMIAKTAPLANARTDQARGHTSMHAATHIKLKTYLGLGVLLRAQRCCSGGRSSGSESTRGSGGGGHSRRPACALVLRYPRPLLGASTTG